MSAAEWVAIVVVLALVGAATWWALRSDTLAPPASPASAGTAGDAASGGSGAISRSDSIKVQPTQQELAQCIAQFGAGTAAMSRCLLTKWQARMSAAQQGA